MTKEITIQDLIRDITTTHAGMAYNTPYVFNKDGKINKDILKRFLQIWKYELVNTVKMDEELEPEDYSKIRSLIRSELASVMFFLFKKRAMWIN